MRTLLELHGKAQADLARFLPARKSTVSAWCTEKALPQLETIDRIAEFFHISTSVLLMDVELTLGAPPDEPDTPPPPRAGGWQWEGE